MPFEYAAIARVPIAVQREKPQQPVDAIDRRLCRQAAQLADHRQILQAAEMGIQVRLFRDVADALLVRDQVALDGFAL